MPRPSPQSADARIPVGNDDNADRDRERRFVSVVEPHLGVLRSFVLRRDRDLADDVLSKVAEVAWRRLEDIPSGKERAWLFGVTRNVLMADRRTRAQREARVLGSDALERAEAPGIAEVVPPLAQALGQLSERDRELLLLTAWEGLRTAEVAEALGIRPTAARMGLVRARRRLALALDELDPDWRSQHFAAADIDTDDNSKGGR